MSTTMVKFFGGIQDGGRDKFSLPLSDHLDVPGHVFVRMTDGGETLHQGRLMYHYELFTANRMVMMVPGVKMRLNGPHYIYTGDWLDEPMGGGDDMKKFGVGQPIIDGEDSLKKDAKDQNWKDADETALDQENKE